MGRVLGVLLKRFRLHQWRVPRVVYLGTLGVSKGRGDLLLWTSISECLGKDSLSLAGVSLAHLVLSSTKYMCTKGSSSSGLATTS